MTTKAQQALDYIVSEATKRIPWDVERITILTRRENTFEVRQTQFKNFLDLGIQSKDFRIVGFEIETATRLTVVHFGIHGSPSLLPQEELEIEGRVSITKLVAQPLMVRPNESFLWFKTESSRAHNAIVSGATLVVPYSWSSRSGRVQYA